MTSFLRRTNSSESVSQKTCQTVNGGRLCVDFLRQTDTDRVNIQDKAYGGIQAKVGCQKEAK